MFVTEIVLKYVKGHEFKYISYMINFYKNLNK